MEIKNRKIIITGATGGLGGALIKLLSRYDCHITAVGRNKAVLETLKKEYGVTPLALDLTTIKDREKFSSYASKESADILINCAAILNIENFASCPENHIDDVVAINLTALMSTTRAVLPLMLKKTSPCKIINIGSVGGDLGLPYFTVYTATKFATKGFTESLQRELGGTNTDAVLIAPRAMKTPLMNEDAIALLKAMFSQMDPVDDVAQKIIRTIEKDGVRRRIGLFERLGGLVNGIMPWTVDLLFRVLTPIMKKHVDKMHKK